MKKQEQQHEIRKLWRRSGADADGHGDCHAKKTGDFREQRKKPRVTALGFLFLQP